MSQRRRTPLLAGALAALLATVAVLVVATWLVVRSDPYVAPTPGASAPQPDPGGAAQALRGLEDALTAGDVAAAAALAPSADPRARDLLTAVVGNAGQLRLRDFSARYVDAVGATDPAGRWQAAVELTWRFDGFDRAPARAEVLVGFQSGHGPDQVAITSFGGGDRRTPLWLTGPLEVRRSDRTLVLATTPAEADLVAGRADAAVAVVQDALPRWGGRLVVEVPSSEEGLDAALAADPGTYAGIAAVSATVDGTTAPGAAVHVFVNPAVYGRLDPVGGQVVMSHEATHVATDAPLSSGVPLWLLEGFADFVALRGVDLPISTTAAQVIEQVRREGPPERLPGQAEFDQGATHLGAVYEGAWVACLVLVEAGGEEALVRLYQEVSAGQDLGDRLRAGFGMTEGELTARWQRRLQDLAAAATGGA